MTTDNFTCPTCGIEYRGTGGMTAVCTVCEAKKLAAGLRADDAAYPVPDVWDSLLSPEMREAGDGGIGQLLRDPAIVAALDRCFDVWDEVEITISRDGGQYRAELWSENVAGVGPSALSALAAVLACLLKTPDQRKEKA